MPTLNDLREIFSRNDDDDDRPKVSRAGEIECLRDALAAFQRVERLEPGMIVRQKPACTHYVEHSDNKLGIVVALLPSAIIKEDGDPTTSSYRQPMDMVVGIWHPEGKFLLFHVDSRRYEPAEI